MGNLPATGVVAALAGQGRNTSSNRSGTAVQAFGDDKVSQDIRKNLEQFQSQFVGRGVNDQDLAFGTQALRDFSGTAGRDLLNRGLIDEDEFEFLQTSATGATDETKVKALGNVYRKLVGRSQPGKTGTLSGADTDAALLAVRRGKELREFKKDQPGLRAQTLLGNVANPSAPGTPQRREENER